MRDYVVGKGKPPVHTRFKKGVSGNPTGSKPQSQIATAIKRLTAAEVAEIGTIIVSKNIPKLREILRDAKTNPNSKHSILKVWIAQVAFKGLTKGDPHALDVLLNRLIGKVKDQIELTGQNGGPVRQIVGAMTQEERLAELKILRKNRKDAGED